MAYLDHVRACNRFDPSNFVPFLVDGERVGSLRLAFAQGLGSWPNVFRVMERGVELSPGLKSFEQRTAAIAEVLAELLSHGVISHLLGEPYPVTAQGPAQAVMLLDRAAAPYFGIRAFGQHVNGYVRRGDDVFLWVARRSRDRRNYPGKFDNLAAGGLPWGVSLTQNLAKEAWEEAGIPPELVRRARPVGALTYCMEMEKGLKPDTLYCYDLELPVDFEPRCTDGEVEGFALWPLARVAECVRDSEDFKRNCNLVLIDFFIRHGHIGPEHEDYIALNTGLRGRVSESC
jgi:8-oxo-dGTP pyrophosphatase MutT (NUDIX family)